MNDKQYYQTLNGLIDEAVKNSVNNVADIGRLNEMGIETTRRLKEAESISDAEMELEVTNTEYLEELQRMIPIARENRRFGHLIGWMKEVGSQIEVTDPNLIIALFIRDMDHISGKAQEALNAN